MGNESSADEPAKCLGPINEAKTTNGADQDQALRPSIEPYVCLAAGRQP